MSAYLPCGHDGAISRAVACLAVLTGASLVPQGAMALDPDCISPPEGGPQGSEICNLGTLDGYSSSIAVGVNADGTVVVGTGRTIAGTPSAFRWVEGGTGGGPGNPQMQNLGSLPGQDETFATGVSDDGAVVVGFTQVGANRAFRWVEGGSEGDPGNPQMQDLGDLFVGGGSWAAGVNADGTVVVGGSFGGGVERAFRWVQGGTGGVSHNPQMEDLGTLDGGSFSGAMGVNADGTVVVGYSDDATDRTYLAFRWVEGGTRGDPGNLQMQNLGTLDGGSLSSANSVNADGTVVVGFSDSAFGGRAFRWVEGGTSGDPGNPEMENLGTLDGMDSSVAEDVNAHGNVVVGYSSLGTTDIAFRWVLGGTSGDPGNPQMERLGTLSGYHSSQALGVNDDGTVVVGWSHGGSNPSRAFIWRGVMQDLENLLASFPVLAADSAVALAEQQFALGRAMAPGGLAAAGQTVMSASAGGERTGRNPTALGARTTSLAALSFGRGIGNSVTLGATISFGGTSLNENAFDMDSGFGGAIWGQYSKGAAARTGLQLSGALGYMRAEGGVARGRLLADVLPATGRARVETRAIQGSLGYGRQQGKWLVTPSIGLAHYDTIRAAYVETGAAFNASHDAMRSRRTVATLDVVAEIAIGAQGRLSLGIGLDHELGSEPPRLTGTSDIPGLTSFDIASTAISNRTRAFATFGYSHEFGGGATLSGDLRLGQAAYGTTPSIGVGISYAMRF